MTQITRDKGKTPVSSESTTARKRRKEKKPFAIECRAFWFEKWREWTVWKRYATEKARFEALEKLEKNKNHGFNKLYIEFRAAE